MKTTIVDIAVAAGKLLGAPVFHSSGKTLLARGRLLSVTDIEWLQSHGHSQVAVTVLEEGEIPETEAAIGIASQAACGAMEIRPAAGGRMNLHATEDCCLIVDEQLLRRVNASGFLIIATRMSFSYAKEGVEVATVNATPIAVPYADYKAVLDTITKDGPLMQARPIRNPVVGVLYSDPHDGGRARRLFEGILRRRLTRLGAGEIFDVAVREVEPEIASGLDNLLRRDPAAVLVASTTSPSGLGDVVARAITKTGCRLESFMAPVEPGNLLLLAYRGAIPVVAAPGCFNRAAPNVIDLVLPALLAHYPLSAGEIASWGHRGLLQ